MRGGPVYVVKPKYIFKHPFNKYDLANPSNRQSQNEQLTDYFNYGFNEDTMNIYGKLVKRFIEVIDHHKNLEYFNEPSELMRLNDEIPMDFGGFCKFYDPWIVDNETPDNFHDGEKLMRYFIMMICANVPRKMEYPLIDFITKMYKKDDDEDQDSYLYDILEQIGKNIEQKYNATMEKLINKANEAKNPVAKKTNPPKGKERRQEEPETKKSKSHHKSSKPSEDSSSDSSEEKSQERRKGRKKEKKEKKEKSWRKKEKKSHKIKKVKKEKNHKRSKSRDKKKKHH